MIRFENVDYFYYLVLIPFFILLYIFIRLRRKALLKKYGNYSIISTLFPEVSYIKPLIKFILVMVALSGIIFASANMQVGTKLAEAKQKSGDVIVAIDISNSMLAKDKPGESTPSRLEMAKHYINQLIEKMQGDKIGIIAFAGEAVMHLPITSDYSAAKLFLSTIDVDIVGTQGTAIGSAIEMAINSFDYGDENEANNKKTLIIISDGENHEENPVEWAKKAVDKNIIIHTIGMGTKEGSPIPSSPNSFRTGSYIRDNNGEIILTKLDDDMLIKISNAANGKYVRAADQEPDLALLLKEIENLEKTELGSKKYSEYDSRFQYFVALAFLFLFIEFLITERKSRIFSNINLFGDTQK